jgi:hypothetical protein
MGVKTDGCSYAEEWDVIVFHFLVQSPNSNAEQPSQLFDCQRFFFGPQLLNESHLGASVLRVVGPDCRLLTNLIHSSNRVQ